MEIIRQETEKDYNHIEEVVKSAFLDAKYSNGKEYLLVKNLRNTEAYVPFLSLVFEVDEKIIGHVMFSKVTIKSGDSEYTSLSLAPLSVLPEYQKQDVGTKLVREGLRLSKDLGFYSVVVVGSSEYYSRFDFVPASKYNLKTPFKVPDENFMVLELMEGALKSVEGEVVYPKEFFE